jgi:hypothetical protein
MSRGMGYVQRYIFELLRHTKKPMTFTEIRDIAEPLHMLYSEQRSFRRALRCMVADGGIMTIGKGGPADPYRYCVHPMILAMIAKDKAEYEEMTRELPR